MASLAPGTVEKMKKKTSFIDRRISLKKYLRMHHSQPKTQHSSRDQLSSPLFTKLPLELRLAIYKHILRRWPWCDTLHVVEGYQVGLQNTVYHAEKIGIPCAAASGDPYSHLPTYDSHWRRGHATCKGIGFRKGQSLVRGVENAHVMRYLSFLRVCQRMYSEAVDLLYSEIRMDLCGLDTTYSFLTFLPRERLRAIRSLSFDIPQNRSSVFPPPERYGQGQLLLWSVARHLEGMSGLKELCVKIYGTVPGVGWDEKLLRPLMMVAIPKLAFVVELSWGPELDVGVDWEIWKYAPFSIERKARLLVVE